MALPLPMATRSRSPEWERLKEMFDPEETHAGFP